MALTLPAPPQGGTYAVGRALDHFGAPLAGIGAGAVAGEAFRPIPLYLVEGGTPVGRDPAAAATRVGWRYIVRDGEGQATIDISDEKQPQLLRMRRGEAAERLLRAAARAEAGDDGQEREVRILMLGRPQWEVLWLSAPGSDRYIPLAGGRSLRTPALLRRLRRAAPRAGGPETAPAAAARFEPDPGDIPSA